MRWKLYFIIFTLLNLFIVYSYIELFPQLSIRDIYDIVLTSISFIGVYIYVFNKKFLYYKFWRIIFLLQSINLILYLLYIYTPLSKLSLFKLIHSSEIYKTPIVDDLAVNIGSFIFVIIMISPMIYAHWKLAYPEKKVKNNI
jgi:hypothetical protein